MRVLTFFLTPQMSAVSRLCATRQVVCTALRWHREDAGEKVKYYSIYMSFSNSIWNSFSSFARPNNFFELSDKYHIVFVGNAVPTNLWCFLGCNKYHVNTNALIIQRTSRGYNSLYLKNYVLKHYDYLFPNQKDSVDQIMIIKK